MENQRLSVSVSDFIALTNQTLEYAFPSIDIEGEVANFKVNQGKYVFFDLKDEGGTLNCFMSLFQMRQPIEDGMKLNITAAPKVTSWGRFSVTVRSYRLVGEGAIKKSFELLKEKLDKEGLFAEERKRPLSYMPRRVAVISSTQAAGYADFIKILGERWGGLQIDVGHVQVQGEGAADQIIRALDYFNEQEEIYDAIVLIRGGGSADDLATFNDELLVRAIAKSRTLVLTGIGHETDEHLADLVADRAAATPSNAAQLLTPDKRALIESTRRDVRDVLRHVQQHLDDMQEAARSTLEAVLEHFEDRLEEYDAECSTLQRLIRQYDPTSVLRRGYSIIKGELVVGKPIIIEQIDKRITAEVTNVEAIQSTN